MVSHVLIAILLSSVASVSAQKNLWNRTLATGDFGISAEAFCPTPADGKFKPVVSLQSNPYNPQNRYAGFNLEVTTDGTIVFFMGGGGDPGSPTQYGVLLNGGVLPSSVGTALRVEVRNATVSLYVNGLLAQTGTFKGLRQTTDSQPIRIGGYTNGGGAHHQYWNGDLRNVIVVAL